jgi:hypothetical protein
VPATPAAWGFTTGMAPAAAAARLASAYPGCRTEQTVYRRSPDSSATIVASLAINPGLAHHDLASPDFCQESPAGGGVTDTVELRFVHPAVDPGQPLYRIEVKRVFPDALFAPDKRVVHAFDPLRASLLRDYGKPRDERREKTASASANFASSLGVGRAVPREDQVVRYLWASQGKLPPQEFENSTCDCGGPYVKAEIETTRSPGTVPRGRPYALTVRLVIEDPELRKRQDAWNAQWLQPKAEGRP